jgi:hypothetical protein
MRSSALALGNSSQTRLQPMFLLGLGWPDCVGMDMLSPVFVREYRDVPENVGFAFDLKLF